MSSPSSPPHPLSTVSPAASASPAARARRETEMGKDMWDLSIAKLGEAKLSDASLSKQYGVLVLVRLTFHRISAMDMRENR
ncbi:hypothetical protein GCM10010443_61470 [Actinoplanes cyaneus]